MGRTYNIIMLIIVVQLVRIHSLIDDGKFKLKKNHLRDNIMSKVAPFSANTVSQRTINSTTSSNVCTCAIFLTGQFKKGSTDPPNGNPAILHELDKQYPCNIIGQKYCKAKCLDSIIKYLPNSASIICAAIDRDCHKERAYLFIQNCDTKWHNTNLSAGKEYCCRNSTSYNCPFI